MSHKNAFNNHGFRYMVMPEEGKNILKTNLDKNIWRFYSLSMPTENHYLKKIMHMITFHLNLLQQKYSIRQENGIWLLSFHNWSLDRKKKFLWGYWLHRKVLWRSKKDIQRKQSTIYKKKNCHWQTRRLSHTINKSSVISAKKKLMMLMIVIMIVRMIVIMMESTWERFMVTFINLILILIMIMMIYSWRCYRASYQYW